MSSGTVGGHLQSLVQVASIALDPAILLA